MTATYLDFVTNTAEKAVTDGCNTTLIAIGAATANVIGWDWSNLGGAFIAGFTVSVITSFAKRNIGAKNETNIVPAIDPALAPAHRA